METVFDPDLHLDTRIGIRGHSVRMYPNLLLLDHFAHTSRQRDPEVVAIRQPLSLWTLDTNYDIP